MTQVMDPTPVETTTDADLVAAIQNVLEASEEPLTIPKLKSQLPTRFRSLNVEDVLRRQVAANVWHQFPKYRSPQDRFWHRPMEAHVAVLLRTTLQEGPLPLSELRRKLPAYAQPQAEGVLQQLLAQKTLHTHPRAGGRGGDRVGVLPPDPKEYLRTELAAVFQRLSQLGFTHAQLQASALELLHEEEWASPPPAPQAQAAPEALPAAPPAVTEPALRPSAPSAPEPSL